MPCVDAQDAQQEIRDLATAPDTPTKSPKKRRRPRTPGSKENLSDVKPKKLFDDSAMKDRPRGSSIKKQEPEMEPADHDAANALDEAATDTDDEDADIFSGQFAVPKKGRPGANSVQTEESQEHPAQEEDVEEEPSPASLPAPATEPEAPVPLKSKNVLDIVDPTLLVFLTHGLSE